MVQEVINVGAFPNDGTGDPIRTAKSSNGSKKLDVIAVPLPGPVPETPTFGEALPMAAVGVSVGVWVNGFVVG